MKPLLDSARMARLDRHTIEKVGLPGAVLMEAAGRGVFNAIVDRFAEEAFGGKCVVICGKGNNGGDGFVVARCLHNAGAEVEAFLLGSRGEVGGDARLHLEAYLASGGILFECGEGEGIPGGAEGATLLVDAIFGTGLTRPVKGIAALWIDFIRTSRGKVVSVDLPSGVSADTGEILGEAVEADLTVTFGHLKKGHFFYPGRTMAGEVVVAEIGIPPGAVELVKPDLWLVDETDFAGTFRRAPEAHKGHFGHVAVLAGGRGRMGAAGLAAFAALKAGAGLSTAVFPAGLTLEARLSPELMSEPLGTGTPGPITWSRSLIDGVREVVNRVDGVVVGPGMGTTEETADFLGAYLAESGRPATVFDADALTLLSGRPDLGMRLTREDVLTPHPGEAARLLSTDNAKVQAGREAAATELAKRYGCVVVLKGAGTLIADRGTPTRFVACGNPGMATAGSGDVLAGVIGAFIARGLPSLEAATAGVWVHSMAGDAAAGRLGMEGLTAGDIISNLPGAMNRLSLGRPTGEKRSGC